MPLLKVSKVNEELIKEVQIAIKKLGIIPEDKFVQFVERLKNAIIIFHELEDNAEIASNMRDLLKLCKKPDYRLINFFSRASERLIEVIEQVSPLPDLPNKDDKDQINDFAFEIRTRIIAGGIHYSDRVHHKLRGPTKMGRPKSAQIDFLVSLVVVAFVDATGQTYRRAWDSDFNLPFQEILIIIFKFMNIESSVENAIRRQKNYVIAN